MTLGDTHVKPPDSIKNLAITMKKSMKETENITEILIDSMNISDSPPCCIYFNEHCPTNVQQTRFPRQRLDY
jgi:hypothetical protein